MIRFPLTTVRLVAAALVLLPAVALGQPSPWKSAVLKFDRLGGKLSILVDKKTKARSLNLSLDDTKATDASLKGLADLVPAQQRVARASIGLEGTQITDTGLTEMAKLGRKVPLTLNLRN